MTEEKHIVVSINGKEVNKISLEDAIKRKMTVKSIVRKSIEKSPEIRAVEEFFVKVNGKRVIPKDVKNMSMEHIETIEIFDGEETA